MVFVELLLAFVAPGLMLALAYAGGRFAARALGIPDFRLLRPAPPGSRWQRFGVRALSVVAVFVGCLLLGIVATIAVGRKAPTTTVLVHDGPARYAGMRDGDRVVSINGRPCTTWESLRDDVRSSPETKTIVIDRNGERLTVEATPNKYGVIGIEPQYEERPVTAGEAIENGLAICFVPLRHLTSLDERSTLSGAVGIAKTVRGEPAASRRGTMLYLSALLSSYAWVAVLGLHLFDVLLHWFRRERR